MQTQIPTWRKLIPAVAFTLLCVVLTLLAVRVFGGSLPLGAQGYRFTVLLPEAANLVAGSDVQSAGVDIGRVVDVGRRGNRAEATVQLESPYAPLRAGARAIMRTKTLLGEGYLELTLGSASAPTIREGARLPSTYVQRAVPLDRVLSTFNSATRKNLRELFAGMSNALDERGRSLNNALGRAAPFTGSLAEVLASLDDQQTDLRRLISSSADVLGAVGERQSALRTAVTAGDDVLAVTARRNRGLSATIRELPPFLRQLRTTSQTIRAVSPDLNDAVSALRPVAPLVRPTLDEIRTAAPEFRGLFRDLPTTIAAGNRGLPAITDIVRAARGGFRAFYPTARELIPFMQLFAANRLSPVFVFANVAAVSAGSFVGPGGKVVGYATGLPTIWNETIAGWKRKLPTNRQNPYPKPPFGLLDTGRIGVLKSYDCRNTGNPSYLGPTGPGAPPCILQGPWEFNGKSAFYPRLSRAAP